MGQVQGDITLNIYKYLNSLWKPSNILGKKFFLGSESLNTHFPTRVHETRNKKKDSSKSKEIPKVFQIDLSKLEKNKCLTDKEKSDLMYILKQIKYDTGRMSQPVAKPSGKPSNRKTNEKVSRPTVKDCKIIRPKNKVSKITGIHRSKDRKNQKIAKKNVQSRECKACQQCNARQRGGKCRPKMHKSSNQIQTTITVSKEKILRTLINLDPGACGEGGVFPGPPSGSSSRSVATVKDEKNINISSIELKYLNPTYVVQYNMDGGAGRGSVRRGLSNDRSRTFSVTALDAHFGRRPGLSVVTAREGAQDDHNYIHYDDSRPHIIGTGEQTRKLMREKDKEKRARLLAEEEPVVKKGMVTFQCPLEVHEVSGGVREKGETLVRDSLLAEEEPVVKKGVVTFQSLLEVNDVSGGLPDTGEDVGAPEHLVMTNKLDDAEAWQGQDQPERQEFNSVHKSELYLSYLLPDENSEEVEIQRVPDKPATEERSSICKKLKNFLSRCFSCVRQERRKHSNLEKRQQPKDHPAAFTKLTKKDYIRTQNKMKNEKESKGARRTTAESFFREKEPVK